MKSLMSKIMQKNAGQSGATLVVIIITILVMGIIGAAIYALTYTATLNQVIAQRAAKVFYLAESGLRIAASEYKTATDKNAKMVALHNQTFTTPDNIGTITIEVYPYWLYAAAGAPADATTLYLPGGVPPEDDSGTDPITFPATGLLMIKDVGRTPEWEGATNKAVYSSVAISPSYDAARGTQVTFTFSTPFSDSIIPGDELYIGYLYTDPTAVEADPGDDLVLNIDDDSKANMFPPQKGIILVVYAAGVSQYSYDSRILDTSSTPDTVTFTNIQAVAGATAPQWPLTVINGREIYVGRSIGFRSGAEFGD